VRLSTIGLPQIDLLSCPIHGPLSSLQIGRHCPQPQSNVERIKPERGPEGQLADTMLFRMTGTAQWDGVAIARLHPFTTVGTYTNMRGLRWRWFATGYAGQLSNKSQVLHPPAQVGLGLAMCYAARDTRNGHWSKGLPAPSGSGPQQALWSFLSRQSRNQIRDTGRSSTSAVRAIFGCPPIHIRPDLPAARVQNKQTLWV
jgi:hypothetical protein